MSSKGRAGAFNEAYAYGEVDVDEVGGDAGDDVSFDENDDDEDDDGVVVFVVLVDEDDDVKFDEDDDDEDEDGVVVVLVLVVLERDGDVESNMLCRPTPGVP